MNDNNFISFPTINKVSVYNYPLFNYGEDNMWTTDFINGLNLFIGANSIGKTTTINMVVYGIVGEFRNSENTDVNPHYFQERLFPVERNTQNQIIEVEFTIDNIVINIQRNLKKNIIENLTVFEDKTRKNIEIAEYQYFLQKTTKISDISDLAFVLGYLIIREEEGNYLLWQKNEQSKIFSILLNQANFHHELTNLRIDFDIADKNYKVEDDNLKEAKKRMNFFKLKQKEQLSSDNSQINIETLNQKLEQNKKELQKGEQRLIEEQSKLSTLQPKVNNISSKYSNAWNKLIQLQQDENYLRKQIEQNNNLLTNIQFKSSTIDITKNKLVNNQICSFCEATLTAKQADKILKLFVEHNSCPICSKDLKYEKTGKTKEEIIAQINQDTENLNKTSKQLTEANAYFQKIDGEKKNIDNAFNAQNKICSSLSTSNYNLSLEITSINNRIFDLSKNKKIEKTDYDLLIYKQETEIKIIEKEANRLYAIRANKLSELSKKNKTFTNEIGLLQEKISSNFNRYAKEYFKEQSSLEFYSIQDDNNLYTGYFVPKVDNMERKHKTKVSQSERVFLEYLFRLAIIELYYERSKHSAFLMLETSEGVFDISNTGQVARLFAKFGQENFPVVVITNRSKDDFIKALNPKKRFDFIKHGKRLSKKQKVDLQNTLF